MRSHMNSGEDNMMTGAAEAGWGKANPDIKWVKGDGFK